VKYRSKNDIVAQVLQSSIGGANRTKIMFRSFLSYRQTTAYLSVLVECNLLSFDKTTETYRTTEKGHRFLELYDQMDRYFESEISELPRM